MTTLQGKQTDLVTQALICYIHDHHLTSGSRLPSQSNLRRLLKVGSVTIQRALHSLESAGIVEILPHRGVVLKRLCNGGYVGRMIGLVCMRRIYSPSTASFLQCCQLRLADVAGQSKLFLRKFPSMTHVDSLDYYDGLRRCIEQHEIQGLLTTVSFDEESWSFLRRHHIPVVSLGSASQNKGFKVDTENLVSLSLDLAISRGFTRPVLFHGGYPVTEQVQALFCSRYPARGVEYCYFLNPTRVAEDRPMMSYDEIAGILDRLSAQSSSLRPDVLLVPDDFIAVFISQYLPRLQARGCSWSPHVIYMVNRQIPILSRKYFRGDCFEVDLMELASRAVSLLVDVICGRETEEHTCFVRPKLFKMEASACADDSGHLP